MIKVNPWQVKNFININAFLDEVGGLAHFTARFFKEGFRPRYEFAELLRQSSWVGYKSLPMVGTAAFIMGLVLTTQSRPTLLEFG